MKRPAAAPLKRPAAAKAPRPAKAQKALPDKLPVTTLCGFLGAGKTTLLKHILETKHPNDPEGFRCAVIVNDVAELNIDKSLIDNSGLIQSDDVIALQNGCVCCTLQNDLVTQIVGLAKQKTFEYMIIEASGVSEPSQIAKCFAKPDHSHGEEGGQVECLYDLATLDTCVTVVDAGDFFDKFESIEKGPEDESYPQLLVEQVEYANVVIVNKADVVSSAQLDKVRERVSMLNPRAQILTARRSQIDVAQVVSTGLYTAGDFASLQAPEAEKVEVAARYVSPMAGYRKLSCGAKRTFDSGKSKVVVEYTGLKFDEETGETRRQRHTLRFGIASFIYRARRPFHPDRFDEQFIQKFFIFQGGRDEEGEDEAKPLGRKAKQEREAQREAMVKKQQKVANEQRKLRTEHMGDLFRSKGFLWLANRHDFQGVYSHAGSVATLEFPENWMVLQREAWEGTEEAKAAARKDWVEPFGDRRQDLVFIGKDLKHDAIQEILDDCLLTDEEMAMGVDGWKAIFGDVLLDTAADSEEEAE